MFVNQKSSKEDHNKSYDYENNKFIQKPKIQKSPRRKCRRPLNHKSFSENFIYDPLDVFYEPTGSDGKELKFWKLEASNS